MYLPSAVGGISFLGAKACQLVTRVGGDGRLWGDTLSCRETVLLEIIMKMLAKETHFYVILVALALY